jgi:hypothetical protein
MKILTCTSPGNFEYGVSENALEYAEPICMPLKALSLILNIQGYWGMNSPVS